jgi:hypothetical protein
MKSRLFDCSHLQTNPQYLMVKQIRRDPRFGASIQTELEMGSSCVISPEVNSGTQFNVIKRIWQGKKLVTF